MLSDKNLKVTRGEERGNAVEQNTKIERQAWGKSGEGYDSEFLENGNRKVMKNSLKK